jgi:sterol desaturase/sphingolipid hydroxylase (fatty acid hydroxylase superfamily)
MSTLQPSVNYYKGNFGNLLFFWDVLFGTAKISRQYPKKYGIEGMKKAEWAEQLFWPLIKPVKNSTPQQTNFIDKTKN